MTTNPPLLVTTEWLAAHLHDPQVRVVDIRGHVLPASEPPPHYFNHRADYDACHIPGVVFVDWVLEITDPADPRHAKIAPPERFAAVMQRIGVGPDTFVVAYDDAAGMFAARLWWSLNYFGHPQVVVLDGGWTAWTKENRPVTAEVNPITPAAFVARPNPAWIRSGEQVLAALHSSTQIVDVRSVQEFNGEYARAKRTGHIPGAINQPRTDLVGPDGRMLPPETLRAKFAAQGIRSDAPEIITYCNAGVSASYGALALRVAGLDNAVVYDGSWKDWGNDDSKPIEK